MFVAEAGRGPAILLIHAFPLDGRMWAQQISDLASDYTTLAPDIPGFGKSPRPDGKPSLDEWARDLVAACKSLGAQTALVAGCSMGGYLTFSILRMAPGFATGLCLINTRAVADSQDARRTRYEMVERARHEGSAFLQAIEPPLSPYTLERRPDVVASVLAMTSDATPGGVMAAQRAMATRRDSRDALASIDVPVTVAYGEDDPLIPFVEVKAMASAIPGSELVTLPHAGHLPPVEDPQAVSAILRALGARVGKAT